MSFSPIIQQEPSISETVREIRANSKDFIIMRYSLQEHFTLFYFENIKRAMLSTRTLHSIIYEGEPFDLCCRGSFEIKDNRLFLPGMNDFTSPYFIHPYPLSEDSVLLIKIKKVIDSYNRTFLKT